MAPKIGVFVCRCGINIAAYVDVPAVVEYAKTLPGVEYAEENMYTCSSDGLNKIKEAIKKHSLERVVVASCTPRTHEPLFQATCEEAGVNKYLFEMANIRDQCSWVHMREPEKATEKAKDLIRMAVAKATLLEPGDEPEIDVNPSALVIGGGVSGMRAALSIADQGFDVTIVEKEPNLGGKLRGFDSLFPHKQKTSEVLEPLIKRVTTHPRIRVLTESAVKSVYGFIGNFDIGIDAGGKAENFNVGTIIVAVGAEVLKPRGLYLYGEDPRVVTQSELEQLLHAGMVDAGRIVMIQCAGSRSVERPYCSRICCNEAVKNAINVAEKGREVYILYRDLQTYGIHYSRLEQEAKRKGVKFLKYQAEKPPLVTAEPDGLRVSLYSPTVNEAVELRADMLVLSTPLIPVADAKELSQMLKVPLDSNGFFMEAHVKLRPIDFATDGIFVCGTAHSPKDVGESVAQALGVASRASIPMAKKRVRTAAIMSQVDQTRCSGCGTCIEVCPYNALRKNEKGLAETIAAVCKGCGVCGATCPEKAITMHHFTDEQIQAQGLAALEED
ncbi:MAG: CoB--CoM heterodisulfide reductase iron-sulfur subunit A family protein [Candidatus Bathyarchaeota archaeon]|nr:CoB--CoM heterodisulfide reductase iron-sulfur subunit A family protein [Candidatus Bathyarchaeota archaeon]